MKKKTRTSILALLLTITLPIWVIPVLLLTMFSDLYEDIRDAIK